MRRAEQYVWSVKYLEIATYYKQPPMDMCKELGWTYYKTVKGNIALSIDNSGINFFEFDTEDIDDELAQSTKEEFDIAYKEAMNSTKDLYDAE